MTNAGIKEKFQKERYTWGVLTRFHEVGMYLIIEYVDRDGADMFHPYINGEDTNHSYSSLDEALVGAIAYKHGGLNSQAAYYFCKMIDLI